MEHTWEELMADEIQEKVDASVNNNSEEIAKKLIKKQMPSEDIVEVTNVTVQRLKQLAASLGISLVTA